MNELLRLARAAFDDAQMAYDNEPDTDSAVDKLMDSVANLLNWAEVKENQPPEIVDIPPPPAEPAPEPVCEQPEAAFNMAEAISRQQRLERARQGDVGAAFLPIQTRMRPGGMMEAIPSPPPSIRDTMDNAF